MITTRRAAAASVLVVASVLGPIGAAAAAPATQLSTSRPLREGTLVTLSGSGFAGATSGEVRQCLLGSDDASTCDDREGFEIPVHFADDGSFRVDVTVEQVITLPGGRQVDCAATPCVLWTTGWTPSGQVTAEQPLTIAVPPPPAVRYVDPVFPEVDRTLGVTYRRTTDFQGRSVSLVVDIFEPADDDAERRPLMIWMHGGYFEFGEPSSMHAHAIDLARRGWVSASISYRLRPGKDRTDLANEVFTMRDAMVDAGAAVAWFREHAEEHRIDPRAIAFGGYSAGAVTALHLAAANEEAGGEPARIAAAVSISGSRTFGFNEPTDAPALFFHGPNDDVVPYDRARRSCLTMREGGASCTFVRMEGADHYVRVPYRPLVTRRTVAFLASKVLRPLGYRA